MACLPFLAPLLTFAITQSVARADDVDYAAPADCPGVDTFKARLEEHTPGASGRSAVRIRVDRDGTILRGRLSIDGDDATDARVLDAGDCVELVDALALAAAVALDVRAPTPRQPTAALVAAPSAPPAHPPGHLSLGVAAGAARLLATAPLTSFTGSFGWTRGGDFAFGAPDVFVTLRVARNDVLQAPETARFSALSGALTVCPLAGARARVRLGVCGDAEVGVLSGEGLDIARPTRRATTFVGLGGSGRVGWLISRRLELALSVAALAPLRGARFQFEMPDRVVAEPAAVVVHGALGVVAHFP